MPSSYLSGDEKRKDREGEIAWARGGKGGEKTEKRP